MQKRAELEAARDANLPISDVVHDIAVDGRSEIEE
jgi:hypothetical protein